MNDTMTETRENEAADTGTAEPETPSETACEGAEHAPAESNGRELCRPKFRPAADVVETAEEFQIRTDVPGAIAGELEVQFEDAVLTISAPVRFEQSSGDRFLLREYAVGDWQRKFQLGEKIDAERIHAKYEAGVLTLHLPKVAAAVPRKIAVAGA